MKGAKKQGIFKLMPGDPIPFGATVVSKKCINFSVASLHAKSCELVLFYKNHKEPFAFIPFPDEYKVGNVFAMKLQGIDYQDIEYGFKFYGPYNPKEGDRFDPSKILLDPYAKFVRGRDIWGEEPDWENPYQYRAGIVGHDQYDWQGDRQLNIPIEDLIIYEMHVRGFTRHESSNVKNKGTFAGIMEKVQYLKNLGINCIELMPIFEFDEFLEKRGNYSTEISKKLKNYWGYDSIAFFAPKTGYLSPIYEGKSQTTDELKDMVKCLHKNGIEVILDVVFNHTGESDEKGLCISLKGIDNRIFYMLDEEGKYKNFTGCHNTLNCNNPMVREFILDCLRYWVIEYHIDGFRFDLAAILTRGQDGYPLENPPIIEAISFDPVLKGCKLIAEAWDARGLYQVGTFPSYGRWADWNDKFRDDVRKFLKGDGGMVPTMLKRIQGSPDIFGKSAAKSSINYITSHDGFTLNDLVSYERKHNLDNGEENHDGTDENFSWNWGVEGPTDDTEIESLRKKLIKNALTILMISQGVPMIVAGDEMRRSQNGNNNPYCQDNELTWINWELLKVNSEIFNFFKRMISFRIFHPILRNKEQFEEIIHEGSNYPDISFHGLKPWQIDDSPETRTMAVMFNGQHMNDNIIYTAMNMHWEKHEFILPNLSGMNWYLFANTGLQYPDDICDAGCEVLLKNQSSIILEPRSTAVLVGKKF